MYVPPDPRRQIFPNCQEPLELLELWKGDRRLKIWPVVLEAGFDREAGTVFSVLAPLPCVDVETVKAKAPVDAHLSPSAENSLHDAGRA